MNKELHAYIINQLQRGISREEITNTLLTNGWQIKDIDLAWLQVTNPNYKEEDLENIKNQPLPNSTNDVNNSEKNKVKKPHPLIIGFLINIFFIFMLMFFIEYAYGHHTPATLRFMEGILNFFYLSIALLSLWWFRRNSKK